MKTSTYHQQTNGACERLNSFIVQTLRMFINDNQDNWDDLLPSVMFAYNTSPATQSTGFSPYFLLFGQECSVPIDVELQSTEPLPQTIKQRLDVILHHVKVTRQIARNNLQQAHEKAKCYYDKTY